MSSPTSVGIVPLMELKKTLNEPIAVSMPICVGSVPEMPGAEGRLSLVFMFEPRPCVQDAALAVCRGYRASRKEVPAYEVDSLAGWQQLAGGVSSPAVAPQASAEALAALMELGFDRGACSEALASADGHLDTAAALLLAAA